MGAGEEGEAEGADIAVGVGEFEPERLSPVFVPIAVAIRAAAPDSVSQARLIPGLLISGRAKHLVGEEHDCTVHFPFTHEANPPSMQALLPSVRM